MKVFCLKYANKTMALSTGLVEVDANGEAEVENDVAERLFEVGFTSDEVYTEDEVETVDVIEDEVEIHIPSSTKKNKKPRFKRSK